MKKQAFGMIIGLSIQYLLGLGANLFVEFPVSGSRAAMFTIAWSHFLTASHIVLGLGLLLGSIAFLMRAHKLRASWVTGAAWIGFLAIFVAGYSGETFVVEQKDVYSFIMGVAFIVALLAYGWVLTQVHSDQ